MVFTTNALIICVIEIPMAKFNDWENYFHSNLLIPLKRRRAKRAQPICMSHKFYCNVISPSYSMEGQFCREMHFLLLLSIFDAKCILGYISFKPIRL